MPPTLRRPARASSILVLSLLLVLMSLPAVPNHFLNLILPSAHAASFFTVNSTGDGVDSNLADGICNDGTGACTLRAAIQQANPAGGDNVDFSLPPGSKIILTGGELLIDKGLSIDGPGADVLTVSGNNTSRVLRITAGPVFIAEVTIAEGRAVGGAGIFNEGGNLQIIYSAISGNDATTGVGGGILNGTGELQSSLLFMQSCTISNNRADIGGGGIFQIGTASFINTTISNNSTSGSGGGINNANPATLTNVSITANVAGNSGGGIYNPGIGTLTFNNTLIAGNLAPSGPDGSGANFVSQDYNVIGNTSGAQIVGTTTHNINNVNALLGPLAANGGPTLTHALLFGSPAIDAGNTSQIGDQRSQPRPIDDITATNAEGGNASDIGAYEAHNFQVNSTADSTDGLCTTEGTGNGCTLREAIAAANAEFGADVITFAAALTSGGPATITLLTSLPDLSSDMTIAGPGSDLLNVQRNTAGGTSDFRVFIINSGQAVSISGMTISGGRFNGGAGIFVALGGTLTLSNSTVSDNHATVSDGGGIANSGTLTLTTSTVSGNSGNGIYNERTITLVNSTVSDNIGNGISNLGTITLTNSMVSNNMGNGIRNTGPFPLSVTDSTISGNAGGLGGGIFMTGGVLTLTNSVVSGNTALSGGGIFTGGGTTGDTIIMTNSTVSGNIAQTAQGGGISTGGTLTMTNCTISGNTSNSSGGGGIFIAGSTGSVSLTNSTVSGNAAGFGGGLYNVFGTTNLKNTIVANNVATSGTGPDLNGEFNSQDHNLIENTSGATFTGTNTNNITGLDPLLGPLQNNGGPTQTLALRAGSPALDAGDNCVFDNTCVPPYGFSLTTDQRGTGFSRKVDGPDPDSIDTVDIGAFEAQVFVEDIADQTINEDSSLSFPFDVGGAASITSVTATSSNTVLVPNDPANISISGTGTTRTLLINPAANTFGASTITVTVNGSNSQTMTDTFLLTVNPVNDAPSFTKGPDQTVNENDGAQTVNNWATSISPGAGESGQTLTFNIVNNTNPALFAVAPVISSSGTLTYSPATGVSGTAAITIALMDNGGTANGGVDTSATQSFNINVLEGGTLAFSAATYSVNEGAGSAAITITRSGGSAGTATVLVTASNGTATAGDYFAVSLTLIFNAGEVSKTVNVGIRDDLFNEPDKTINLTLSNAGGSGQLGSPTTAVLTIVDDDPVGGYLRFTSANFNTTESSGSVTITVEHVGETSQAVSVDYATSDGGSATVVPCSTINGIASSRCDFTTALGTLRFAAGESSKTFVVLISQDNYVEGPEGLTLTLSNLTGGALLATPSTATLTIADDASEPATNPIDVTESFVRQHYHDFLNREPDAAGLAFWTGEIENCTPKPQCVELKRINVSAAFFLSIEFQETGYLVQRMYKTAYGDTTSPNVAIPVPIIRLHEFLPDAQRIGQGVEVGVGDWQLRLEANKSAYAREFVVRPRFVAAYPLTMSATEFVNQLDLNAGGVLSAAEREQLIEELDGATDVTQGRASVTRKVAEDAELRQREFNRAFVLMQYYGYMRRNPDDPQDTDFRGWDFWLDKLNQFNGNFVNAEMVKAFISSIEYRQRFGQ